ncbi:MAG: hypothetical protein IT478_01730 [Xanthomonadales bacterium]|nr:hypothetical protein [Xanthomonadales bacterium]
MDEVLQSLKRDAALHPEQGGLVGRMLNRAMHVAPAERRLELPGVLPSLSFVCCSIQTALEARFRAEVTRAFSAWPQTEVCVLNDARSLAEAYNRGAAMTHGEWLVFCHDDIRFLRADFAARLALALQRFDVCGPAGATHLVGPAVLWGGPANGLAHVTYPLPDGRYAATLCGIGPVHARAEALDGVFIAVKRRVWEQVRFDADRFDAFHLYDIDFSYSCHRRGHVVGIAQDLHLLHDSDGSFDERWSIFADRFVRKHNLVVAEAHPNPTGGLIVDDCARIAAMFDALNAA